MLARLLAPLTRQLGRPSGRLGAVVLRLLDRANAGLNAAAIAAADVRPGDVVLDLGFGGGVGLRLLAQAGAVPVGAELSADAVSGARRRHPGLELVQAGADALPFADGRFAAVVSVNTVYFWPDVPRGLAELHRVLAPGGRLVLAIEAADRIADSPVTGAFANTDAAALRDGLADAGFHDARVAIVDRGARLVIGSTPAAATA